MNEVKRKAIAGTTVLLLLFAATVMAQTSGRLVGRVLDSSGAALPGVVVTITSPSMQGTNAATTDNEGNYRFPLLPPGTYTVKAVLAGFKTIQQPNVIVGLDRTVEVNLQLPIASVAETVEVLAASPVVDTTSTTIGISAKAELLSRLPIQRDIYTIARLAPGTTQDAVGPSVFGSTGAENQYIIEGLNVTGLETGGERKTLNFDFVDAIEVKTGGLPAEYGRVTGGIINVVTKSGGNQFNGTVFGFNSGGSLQSDDTSASQRPKTTTTVNNVDRRWDFGGTAGGFIAKDKLWFFGAYAHQFQRDKTQVIRLLSAPGSPAIGSEIPADTNTETFAGKLTYKLSNSQTLVGSVNGDPSTKKGNVFVVAGPESTWKGEQKTGGPDGVVKYTGAFGSSLVVNAMYGRHYEKSQLAGAGATTAQTIDQTVSPNIRTGGFPGYSNQEFTRNYYAANVTKYLGGHEIKGGVDFENNKSTIDRYSGGGGDFIYKLISNGVSSALPAGTIYYRHRYFVNDLAPGFDRSNSSTWTPAVPLTSLPKTLNTAFFAQDSWKVASNVSINGGVRWERQQIKDRNSATVIDLKTNWAPRIGVVWDFAKNGRSKAYASYGRFYESIPLDIDIRAFGGELACFCYNLDPSASNRSQDPTVRRSTILGNSTEPVDPKLRGQYLNEVLVGGDYEVAPNLSVGVKYIRRDLARVIEDFLVPSEGQYFIANPAAGTLGKEVAFYDLVNTAPAPKASRTNDSVEVSARKTFSNNWQLLASYVWSRLEGNYDGTFQNSTGQLDPNINSAFDYADFLVNAQGRLSNSRTNELKVDGSYEFTSALNGLNLAVSTRWLSGTPLNAYGYSFAYANWEYFLAPRGSVGTGPSDWEADLHANYPIKFGGNKRLNLVMNVFNVFDRQKPTQLDQRYNLAQDGNCAGLPVAACNGDNGFITTPGTLTPVASLSNPRATATNPDYLRKGVGFTQPRSVQIGVRLEF
jgi:hypothetical protein